MKIFTKKQTMFITVMCLLLAGIFVAVGLLINEKDINRFSLIATLIFGVASLMTSFLALSISVHVFVKDNQKEKEKSENDARKFIIEHEDELDYIPLCLVARAYNRQHKFERNIYSSFNSLNDVIQKEVLKQLNYNCELINNNGWINNGLSKVESFYQQYDMGQNMLYDDAKYYKKTIFYANQSYDTKLEFEHFYPSQFLGMPDYYFKGNECYDNGLTFDDYLRRYLGAKICNDPRLVLGNPPKPLDYLIVAKNLRNCSELELCFWMMVVVDSAAELLIEKYRKHNQNVVELEFGDGEPLTIEDRFLQSLLILYNLSKYKESD